MKCAWSELLAVIPPRFRGEVDKLGRERLEELHLRIGQPVELILHGVSHILQTKATTDDVLFVVNIASRFSPWSASTAANGYITAPGGHRIGICGECVVQSGVVTGVRRASSVCIRVARAFSGIGRNAPLAGSLLILGPPGVGKTTLLRDIICCRSDSGVAISVVDERGELFPQESCFEQGPRTDIYIGCSKAQGVEMALRTMGPRCIAVDEITAPGDCEALMSAAWCGVDLLATAHAANVSDLHNKPIYQFLARCDLFQHAIILHRDKSWHLERVKLCT